MIAMSKVLAMIIVAALGLGGIIGAIALRDARLPESAPRPVWSEVAWPFPVDQWGKGRAFRCQHTDCGSEVTLYLRAKIGFCNCVTGVSDDAELDRMSDFDLIGEVSPLGAGRKINIGRMHGRSRAYALLNPTGKTAISAAVNDRCDMVVATVVMPHDRLAAIEPGVIAFLNSATVLRWAEVTLGI
jgi:hypothetical protein